jgi:hypothetical protein
MDLRPARCPNCHHQGGVPRTAPMDCQVRCVACGTRAQVRQVVGERPARFCQRSSYAAFKKAAALEIIERFQPGELSDPLDDLFIAGGR